MLPLDATGRYIPPPHLGQLVSFQGQFPNCLARSLAAPQTLALETSSRGYLIHGPIRSNPLGRSYFFSFFSLFFLNRRHRPTTVITAANMGKLCCSLVIVFANSLQLPPCLDLTWKDHLLEQDKQRRSLEDWTLAVVGVRNKTVRSELEVRPSFVCGAPLQLPTDGTSVSWHQS